MNLSIAFVAALNACLEKNGDKYSKCATAATWWQRIANKTGAMNP
jgi:hypothetical protein